MVMSQRPDDIPVYTAHDISDLFNALPVFLGFRPEESLVAVSTEGPRRRFGFRMRMDMPTDLEEVDNAAEVVVHHLRNHGDDGAIVLAISDHQHMARELLLAIESRLGDITPIAIARSNGQRYWVDVPGFPSEGIAYETDESHESIAVAVAAGQQILPDRAALAERVAPIPFHRVAELAAAYDAVFPQVLAILADDDADLAPRALDDLDLVLRRVRAGSALDTEQVARLSMWLNYSGVRDAVASQITDENADEWLQALTHCSRNVLPAFSPSVLALTSYAAWRTGDGALSLIAAERATSEDPAQELALLMIEVLRVGVPPPRWHAAQQRRHAS